MYKMEPTLVSHQPCGGTNGANLPVANAPLSSVSCKYSPRGHTKLPVDRERERKGNSVDSTN